MANQSDIESLIHTVESELIPQLFVNHMMDMPSGSPLALNYGDGSDAGLWSEQEEVERFAALCIKDNPLELDQQLADLLTQGASLDNIFLYLLAPAAQHLGDLWSADQLSFVDVQLGLCRLHKMICECEEIGYRSTNAAKALSSILLSCAPGENHLFGVTMVADFFRRDGWLVSNLSGLEETELLDRIATTSYSVMGFSLHNDRNYEALKSLVRKSRLDTVNKDLIIMVGGDFFIRNPDEVKHVGADVFAHDGRQAVLQARSTLKQIEGE